MRKLFIDLKYYFTVCLLFIGMALIGVLTFGKLNLHAIINQYNSQKSWVNTNIFKIAFDCQNLLELLPKFRFDTQLDSEFLNHYLQSLEKA